MTAAPSLAALARAAAGLDALGSGALGPNVAGLAQLPAPPLGVTFTAPRALAFGVAAAAGLVLLHAVTVGRPRPTLLPTARFAPARPARAARQLRRPADLLLLATRVLAALCAAAALARPVPTPPRRPVARVIVADRSPAADRAAVRAAVASAAAGGDVLVAFADRPSPPLALAADPAARARQLDSALGTRPPATGALGTGALGTGPTGAAAGAAGAPAPLSAALVAARRAAPGAAAGADSLELVLVSPLWAEQVDAATAGVRATWAGRARVLRVPAAPEASAASGAPAGDPLGDAGPAAGAPRALGRAPRPAVSRPVSLRGAPPDDALAAALALAGVPAGAADAPVRVARTAAGPADLEWARGAGRVLVLWDAKGAAAPSAATAATAATGRALGTPPAADTAFALAARGAAGGPAHAWTAVAVAPFVRRAFPDAAAPNEPSRTNGPAGPRPRVVARWADGRPAAVERPLGAGCLRTVAVTVPQAGDAALRAGFRALLPALLGSCGGPRDPAPLPAGDVARLAGRGPLLAAGPLRAQLAPPAPDRLGAALLAAALALLVAELPLRRLRRRAGVDGAAADLPASATDAPQSAALGGGTPGGRGPGAAPPRQAAA